MVNFDADQLASMAVGELPSDELIFVVSRSFRCLPQQDTTLARHMHDSLPNRYNP